MKHGFLLCVASPLLHRSERENRAHAHAHKLARNWKWQKSLQLRENQTEKEFASPLYQHRRQNVEGESSMQTCKTCSPTISQRTLPSSSLLIQMCHDRKRSSKYRWKHRGSEREREIRKNSRSAVDVEKEADSLDVYANRKSTIVESEFVNDVFVFTLPWTACESSRRGPSSLFRTRLQWAWSLCKARKREEVPWETKYAAWSLFAHPSPPQPVVGTRVSQMESGRRDLLGRWNEKNILKLICFPCSL